MWSQRRFDSIKREIRITLRATVNVNSYHVTDISAQIGGFMSSPTIRIILDSFYLLILLLKNCHPESVVYRLPFAIKTILNLSGIVVCFVICARWWQKIWIHQLPPIIMNQVWSKWIKSLSDPGSSVINLSSYKFSQDEKRSSRVIF